MWNKAPLTVLVLGVLSAGLCAGEAKDPWGVRGQVPLSLEALFDNDAIADSRDRADGNFDCPDHAADIPGSTFPAENLPSTGSRFSFNGVHFLFPSKERGDYNNLACSGQRLEVPPGRYKALQVIGASENGSFRGALQLAYKEGPGEAELALTDWCQKASFGERAAFEAACRYTYSSDRGRVVREEVHPRLWLQKVALDPAKTLEGITLPYSRRMHVFAATLVAAEWTEEQATYAAEAATLYASLGRRSLFSVDDLRRRLAALVTQLDQHAAAGGPHTRQFGWLRTEVAYWEHQISGRLAFLSRTRRLTRSIKTLETHMRALLSGNDPFASRRGAFLRSYRSPADGSLQSYSLAVPPDYTGEEPFPLMVTLHGHGWYRPFQGHPQRVVAGVITAAPHGRGSVDYMLLGEDDVLAVVDDVMRDYRVDPDRVILEGHSMGGTGSWQVGVHHPHRFCAIAPVCGNADRRAWDAWKPKRRRIRYEIPPRFATLRTHVLDAIDPITYAANLLNLPAMAAHGTWDNVVPVGHSQNMAARLKKLGCPIDYREFAGVRHWGFPNRFYNERWDWMMAQRRTAAPERVRYRTAGLRHDGAYWLRIDRLLEPLALAEVDARHLGEGRFEVAASNVAVFSLDAAHGPAPRAARLTIAIDGQTLEAQAPSPTLVRDRRGRWRAADLPRGLAKKKGLEGPVGDVFLASFLLVRGTTSKDPWERQVIARQVEARAHDWERMYHCRPRIADDTAVTDADIARHHLVLYGGPGANALTARIAGKLPIRIEKTRIRVGRRSFEGPDVGVKLCYPNPLNPERCVAVFAGLSPDALDQINNRFGNWFGWGPYDNYEWFDYGVFDARTVSPETFLCVGFFDQAWELDERYEFPGDAAARQTIRPQRVPKLHGLPADPPDELMLSDLAPTLIDQHKGTIGFDRSFEANPLTLGGRAFERGLGVRAPSIIEFQLDGRYTRFRATVGIDLENELEVTEARERGEYVQFLVFGDGKRLYSSEWLQWDSRPVDVDVELEDVKTLRLHVDCSSQRWLVGSADWANARVSTR